MSHVEQRRVSVAERAKGSPKKIAKLAPELDAFASWFVSWPGPIKVALDLFLRGLSARATTHHTYDAIRRLSETVDEFPSETLAILKLLVQGDANGWALGGSLNEVENILRRTAGNPDRSVRLATAEVIDLLGAQGRGAALRNIRPAS